jgi:hypothetical protein
MGQNFWNFGAIAGMLGSDVQMDIGEEGILLECLQKTENGEVQIAEL